MILSTGEQEESFFGSVLQILPLDKQHDLTNNEIELDLFSEQCIQLSAEKSTFYFDLILDADKQPELHHHWLYERFPRAITHFVLLGLDYNIVYNGTSSSIHRMDINTVLSLVSAAISTDYQVYISLTETANIQTGSTLSSSEEYHINNAELLKKYYHKWLQQSAACNFIPLFSVTLKRNHIKYSQLNIYDASKIDISQLTQLQHALVYNRATPYLFLTSISVNESIETIRARLSFAEKFSKINSNYTLSAKSVEVEETEGPENLKQIIANLTNQVTTLRSSLRSSAQGTAFSTTFSSSQQSTSLFSSISNSTVATSLHHPNGNMEDQKMVAAAADLYRQIEELENQITVTRERNTHVEHELHETNHTNLTLWQLIQKQDMMIRYLEEKQIETENHITQGIEQLAVERQELGELLDTLESKIKHGDQKINKAIDKMTLVTAIMLKEEDHAILKKRTEELENQVMTLDNIVEQLQLTADIDLVGTASAQQQQQQQASRIKELEAALVNSNEQVKDYSRVKQSLEMLQEEYNMLQKRKRPSFYRTSRIGKYHQVLDWMDENMRDKPEIIEEVANMVYDVSEMTNIIHNLNDQLCIERQQTKERLKLLEADILNLTVMNHHLQQQKKPCESLSRMESGRRSLSPAHTAQSNNLSKVDENQRISSATNLSELSSTVPSRTQPLPPRSHTMSSNTQPQVMEPLPIQPRYTPLSPRLMPRPSPPLNPPPRQPLPQTPAPPPPIHDFEQIIKNYQQKLIIAENENHVHQQTIRALEEKLTTVSTQRRQSLENLKYLIDSERKQKLKAEKSQALLEQRLLELQLQTKKKKFLCF